MTANASAGFNLVTQLSEQFFNRLLKALYRAHAFPTEFDDALSSEVPEYGVSFRLRYDLALAEPSLYFDTNVSGGVGIQGAINGRLVYESAIDARMGESEYTYTLVIDVHANYDIIADLKLEVQNDQLNLVVQFEDIRDFDLALSPAGIPPVHLELVSRLVKRALLVSARRKLKRIPISQEFEKRRVSGLLLAAPVLRIIDGPSPPDFDNATVAMSTKKDEIFGRPNSLYDFINPDYDFGIAMDQNFILHVLERAWNEEKIKKRFNDQGKPDASGKNRIRRITFDLQENCIILSILASRHLVGDFEVHARVSLVVEDGTLHARFERVQIEWPGWIDIVGFLCLTVAWLVVSEVAKYFLGGLIADAAKTGLEEFLISNKIRFAFSGKVPGTDVQLTATAKELTIRPDEIVSRGSVTIELST